MPEANTPNLILIDGSGFIFRAFHALPPMNRADGTPVNAVFGFTNMLARLLSNHEGTHLAVIFDAGRTTFRNDLYDKYKAQRPEPPPELIPQFALVRDANRRLRRPRHRTRELGSRRPHRQLRPRRNRSRLPHHHRLLRQGPDATGR